MGLIVGHIIPLPNVGVILAIRISSDHRGFAEIQLGIGARGTPGWRGLQRRGQFGMIAIRHTDTRHPGKRGQKGRVGFNGWLAHCWQWEKPCLNGQ